MSTSYKQDTDVDRFAARAQYQFPAEHATGLDVARAVVFREEEEASDELLRDVHVAQAVLVPRLHPGAEEMAHGRRTRLRRTVDRRMTAKQSLRLITQGPQNYNVGMYFSAPDKFTLSLSISKQCFHGSHHWQKFWKCKLIQK